MRKGSLWDVGFFKVFMGFFRVYWKHLEKSSPFYEVSLFYRVFLNGPFNYSHLFQMCGYYLFIRY